jgi:hypothetical protein
MLEFLRHQTKPIMFTLAVIIIVAFTFWGGSTRSGAGRNGISPEDTMMTVLSSDYTLADLSHLQRSYRIASELGLPGVQDYFARELYQLKYTYGDRKTGGPLMLDDAPIDFAANLVVLRDALAKTGISASDDEVQQVFRTLGQFQVNGQFDRDRAVAYERNLGERGIKLSDVYDTIRDSIGFQKLYTVVSRNVVSSPKVASEFYAFVHQTIKAASIPFALDDFKKGAKVTDEEIGKYFEENKDNYQSPEIRTVSYVLVEKPNTEGKNAEDTVKARNAYNEKLANLAAAVIAPKADFDAEVKKAGLQVKTVAPFSMEAPPEEFKKDFELLRAIFTNIPSTHAVSDPVPVEKGYVIFKVTNIASPAQQELKDVKDKVRETLVEQKATEAMQKAANDAKAKLEAAIKAGKKFDVAAKEAKFTPQMLGDFSPAEPLTNLSNGRDIAREAMGTPAGSFTKPLATQNGIILVHVLSKELRKSADSAAQKQSLAANVDERTQADLFHGWFDQRYEAAGVKFDPAILNSSLSLH